MKQEPVLAHDHHIRMAITLTITIVVLVLIALLGVIWQQQEQPAPIIMTPVSNNGKITLTAEQAQIKTQMIANTSSAQIKLSPAEAQKKAALIESQKH